MLLNSDLQFPHKSWVPGHGSISSALGRLETGGSLELTGQSVWPQWWAPDSVWDPLLKNMVRSEQEDMCCWPLASTSAHIHACASTEMCGYIQASIHSTYKCVRTQISRIYFQKITWGSDEMAQWVKPLLYKSDELSSNHGTYLRQVRTRTMKIPSDLHITLWNVCPSLITHACTYTQVHIQIINKKLKDHLGSIP